MNAQYPRYLLGSSAMIAALAAILRGGALIPALWRKTMRPLLAEWDRLASEQERALIRQRGWESVV